MDWIYRFSAKADFPEPVEEIDTLCTLDSEDKKVFLLLTDRSDPPMGGAIPGEIVGLCTAEAGELVLHGTAIVDGTRYVGSTPVSVEPLYGSQANRTFCPLAELQRTKSSPLDESILGKIDQSTFLSGQAYVKRLGNARPRLRKVTPTTQDDLPLNLNTPMCDFRLRQDPFSVVGLDPTAGDWSTWMKEGKKKEMPSFLLEWDGNRFQARQDSLKWHSTNESFWGAVKLSKSCLNCIDGPCATNGPKLKPDISEWEENISGGIRSGELALSREGVNLFWTTQNTVTKFDGASRWIARSLVLFNEELNHQKIETHPHGAFTFLWRMFGNKGMPPKKSKPPGMQVRKAILNSFITGLTDNLVPNHDAMDAACASLVAGLHKLDLTIPFGTVNTGGQIWMPNIDKLGSMICSKEPVHV